MTVYVDELRRWPTKIRCFKAGSCHLMADDIDELHAFAKRLGMKRVWYQPKSSPHYDLTASRREKALELGAMFVPAKEQAKARLADKVQLTAAALPTAASIVLPPPLDQLVEIAKRKLKEQS